MTLRSVGDALRSFAKLLVRFVKRLECMVAHFLKILEASFQHFDHVFTGCLDMQVHPLLCRMRHGVAAYPHAGTAEERSEEALKKVFHH